MPSSWCWMREEASPYLSALDGDLVQVGAAAPSSRLAPLRVKRLLLHAQNLFGLTQGSH